MGNICFSFITPVKSEIPPMDMKKYHNEILVRAFNKLGIPAKASGRNDLTCQDWKISGSAFEVNFGTKYKQPKILHHGTILLNADLSVM